MLAKGSEAHAGKSRATAKLGRIGPSANMKAQTQGTGKIERDQTGREAIGFETNAHRGPECQPLLLWAQ